MDQVDERIGRIAGCAHVALLLPSQLGRGQQRERVNHAAERGADFMADVWYELALESVGRFACFEFAGGLTEYPGPKRIRGQTAA